MIRLAALLCLLSAADPPDPPPDWPALSDAQRLPCAETCLRNRAESDAWRHWAEQQAEWYPSRADQYRDFASACGRAYHFWDWAAAARNAFPTWDCCGYKGEELQRYSLDILRTAIGAEAYYAGRWPSPVPIHRLQRLP